MIDPGRGQHARDGEGAAAGRSGLLPAAPPAPAPIRLVGAVVDWSVVAIGAVMVALVFVNVLMHIAHRDNPWTIELCELLMVWVTFLGGASAARRRAHMTITEFIDKLGAGRRYADAAILALSAAVLGMLIWFGIGLVNASWGNELTVLQIAMAWQYLALPVGAGAMLVFVLHDLVLALRGELPVPGQAA